MKKKISIIIRTKNEERWIAQCLRAVFSQHNRDYEVIIVDSKSTDRTIEKVRQFGIAKIITCADYRPGKAINMGIRESTGDFITCLSGHCIPVNENWLDSLIDNFTEDQLVAGVYGKQEPMAFTSDSDKRDLALVFGLDRRVQIKDAFFHNANSVIRRTVWDQIPFDEIVTNIEDRVWAQEILKKGYKIIYEPEASVYHYHGIHQNGDVARCANVVRILDNINADYSYKAIDAENLNIVAIIPVKGPVQYVNKTPLIFYTIQKALESKYIKKAIVSTDDKSLAEIARRLGAETPFLRDPALSKEHIDLAHVYQYSLGEIERNNIFPDLVVCLESTFPFRAKGLLDGMIVQLTQNGFDSVIAAKRENKGIWKEENKEIIRLDEGLTPRQFKEPTFIELKGIGCITHPEFIRQGSILGNKIGMYEIKNPYSYVEVRDEEDLKWASFLIDKYFGE